jgi:endonuclease YncB( thermonuclease family)
MRVESVLDGDTFHGRIVRGGPLRGVKVIRDSLVSVRLQGVDAPEKDQPWGKKAREALSGMVEGDTVLVEIVERDAYRRVLGVVRRDGLDVNAALVAQGHAWMFRKYSDSPVLDSLERAARRTGAGLWAAGSGEPVPPWEWRRRKR